ESKRLEKANHQTRIEKARNSDIFVIFLFCYGYALSHILGGSEKQDKATT
ncbi:2989_t:CDS:1, partial [Racocetra persica]